MYLTLTLIGQFEQEKNNIRNTWKVINSVLNNKKSSQSVSSIIFDGKLINNTEQIANYFNDYFINIGPNLASNIQPIHPPPTFTDYLSNHNTKSFFFTPVNEYEIVNIVKDLQNKKSSGHDTINISIIKKSISSICKPLAHIVNTSFMTGIVPSQLKIAKVIPVFKKGDPIVLKIIDLSLSCPVFPRFLKFFEDFWINIIF